MGWDRVRSSMLPQETQRLWGSLQKLAQGTAWPLHHLKEQTKNTHLPGQKVWLGSSLKPSSHTWLLPCCIPRLSYLGETGWHFLGLHWASLTLSFP